MPGRPLSPLLAIALLPLALAACEAGEPEAEDQPVPGAPAPEAPPAPAGAVADPGNLPPGVTMAMVQEGEQLYGTLCVACHGPAGGGTTLGPALNDDEWINVTANFDEVVNVIHTGVPEPRQFPSPMPPLGGGTFNDEQVRALAAYVWALAHQPA